MSSRYHGLPSFLFYNYRDALLISRIADDCDGMHWIASDCIGLQSLSIDPIEWFPVSGHSTGFEYWVHNLISNWQSFMGNILTASILFYHNRCPNLISRIANLDLDCKLRWQISLTFSLCFLLKSSVQRLAITCLECNLRLNWSMVTPRIAKQGLPGKLMWLYRSVVEVHCVLQLGQVSNIASFSSDSILLHNCSEKQKVWYGNLPTKTTNILRIMQHHNSSAKTIWIMDNGHNNVTQSYAWKWQMPDMRSKVEIERLRFFKIPKHCLCIIRNSVFLKSEIQPWNNDRCRVNKSQQTKYKPVKILNGGQ